MRFPGLKAKEISCVLVESRRDVNSSLYSAPKIFVRNQDHKWFVRAHHQSDHESKISDVARPEYPPTISLKVENVDIVENLRSELTKNPGLKIGQIAKILDEPRQLISRTLASYQDLFEKNSESHWFPIVQIEVLALPSVAVDPQGNFGEATPGTAHDENYKEQGLPPQQAVIEARLDQNILVLAPPGTGKTHTLIERLVSALDRKPHVVDAGELLVLSFTRAAVGEIRERIAKAIADGAPSRLRYVQVRTFDF